MINLCVFTGSFQLGGAENLVLQTVRNIDKTRYNIFIASFFDRGELLQDYKKLGVGLATFPQKKRALVSAFKFTRFLKKNKIQCIHIHLTGTFLFAVTIAKLMRVKNIIIHWHNIYNYKRGFARGFYANLLVWFIIKYSTKLCHTIIAISNRVKNHNCTIFKIDKNKVRTVYNAVDLSLVPHRTIPMKKANSFIIGCIGKVTEQKGYDILIRGFSKVIDQIPDVRLEIIGAYNTKGNEKLYRNLCTLTDKLGIKDKVEFLGELPHQSVYGHLLSWNLFVLASKFEGFGIVIIEAMAAGVPVIGSNVDAIPEIISDEKSGLLFNAGDPQDLAENILLLLKDKNLANQFAAQAEKQVQEKFTIMKMVTELDKVYSSGLVE